MAWRKQYLEAIRALPEEWIDENTHITTFMENTIIAANCNFAPMVYDPAVGKWNKIEGR